METSNIDNINYNELYKLHTGHGVYDSDTDSSDSTTSSSFFQRYKPPLYTYEELTANSVVIEPVSKQNETGSNVIGSGCASKALGTDSLIQQILKKELEKLVLPDSCILCNITVRSAHDIGNHKIGKSHRKKVDQYIKDRLEKLQSQKVAEQRWKSSSVQTSSSISTTNTPTNWVTNSTKTTVNPDSLTQQIIKKELEKLVLPDSCILCNITVRSAYDIEYHKMGKSHQKKVAQYIEDRLKKLQSQNVAEQIWKSSSVQTSSSISTTNTPTNWVTNSIKTTVNPVAQKSLEEKRQERLKELTLPNYCYVCYADLTHPNNAFSHYQSLRHQNNVRDWKDKSLDEILRGKIETLICLDYCYICCADLPQVANAQSHYSSKRHTNKLDIWKSSEITKLQTPRMDTLVPNTVAQVQKIPVQNEANKITRGQFDKSSYKIVQERVENLICSDHCYLCNIDLQEAANAQSHYNSKRHKDNLAAWISSEITTLETQRMDGSVPNAVKQVQKIPAGQGNKTEAMLVTNQNVGFQNSCQNVKTSVESVCMVCGISVGTGLQDHYKSDLHKRCSEAFCFVCKVRTMSKEHLAEHVNGIRHKKNLEKKDKLIDSLIVPQIIVTPEIKKGENAGNNSLMQNTQYNSVRKVEKKETETQLVPNSVPERWCYCDVCKVALDGTEKAENHYRGASHILKNISFYCHICKLTYGSKMEMDLHVKSFPHNELSKLTSLVFSKGITHQEFWIFHEWEILCSLCGVRIQTELSATDHLGSKRHCNNFNKWCSEQSKDMKDPNRRWYFCDICNKDLDGTTNVEFHYLGFAHAKQYKKLLNDDNISAASQTIEVAKTETKGELCTTEKQETSKPNWEDRKKIVDNNANIFYCYACKIKFHLQSELTLHSQSFPHNYAAKLKSSVISQGISTQAFWETDKSGIWCSLCRASLQCESSAKDHLRCSRHVDKFNTWYREQPKDTKDPHRKWHYCDLCNISLDGTTNADLHYQGHSTRVKNTNASQAISASISAGMLKTEKRDVIKVENISEKQEETQIVSKKSKLQNKDLNTTVSNGNEIPADNKNKKQITMKQNSEKVTLENQNTKVSNNETFIDDDKKTLCCYLCKKRFNSQNNLNDHIGSYRHNIDKLKSLAVSDETTDVIKVENISKKQEETQIVSKKPKLQNKDLNTKVSNGNEIPADNENKKNKQIKMKQNSEKAKLENQNTKVSNETFIDDNKKILCCYLCKKQFNSQNNLNDHIGSYPHNCIAKLKSLAVSEGLATQQFWEDNKFAIWCCLCETSLLSEFSAKEHFGCKRHVDNFNIWCQLQPKNTKDHDNKFYFCVICNESLDGTSNAKHHYEGKTHAEKQKIYTEISQTSSTSRHSNISKTDSASVSNSQHSSDVNTETNKNDSKLKATEKIRIESEAEMLLQPEHHYEGETHAEKQKIYTEILQTSTISRPSNISKTDSASVSNSPHTSDVNTETNKNDNKLKAIEKIKIKSEGEKLLKEKVDAKMIELKTVVETIPPDTAVTFLHKFIRELENFKKKPEAPTVNAEQIVNTRKGSKDVLPNNLLIKNRFEHDNPKENRNLNSSVVTEPTVSNNYFTDILTLAIAGIFLIYFLKK